MSMLPKPGDDDDHEVRLQRASAPAAGRCRSSSRGGARPPRPRPGDSARPPPRQPRSVRGAVHGEPFPAEQVLQPVADPFLVVDDEDRRPFMRCLRGVPSCRIPSRGRERGQAQGKCASRVPPGSSRRWSPLYLSRSRRPRRARGPCPRRCALVVKNGSKIRGMTSLGMPRPVSATAREILAAVQAAWSTSDPAGSRDCLHGVPQRG